MKNRKTTKNMKSRKPRKLRNLNKCKNIRKTKKHYKKTYKGGEQPLKKIRVENIPYSYTIEVYENGQNTNKNYSGHYSGDWVDGRPYKEGKFIVDGTDNYYEGSWNDGKPNGFGEMVTQSKMYSGEWLNGKINGTGILEFLITGVIVEGTFKECIRNNIPKICINGVATYPDGSKFIGQFENNEKISGHVEPDGVDNLANNEAYNMEYGIIEEDNEYHEDPKSVTDLPFF
jgi:hypothetical protein